MSWGAYWMFFRCPSCGKHFKSDMGTITSAAFGVCPACRETGTLIGESGQQPPPNPNDYEETDG